MSTGSVDWLVIWSTAFKIIPHHSWHMQPGPAMVASDRTMVDCIFSPIKNGLSFSCLLGHSFLMGVKEREPGGKEKWAKEGFQDRKSVV